MRNRALSVLRARQLIIQQVPRKHIVVCDVNTRNFGSPPRKGLPQELLLKRTVIKNRQPRFSSSIVSVAVRNSRPASAIRVLIRRVQHREPRTAPL
jgi:hypothetical protein